MISRQEDDGSLYPIKLFGRPGQEFIRYPSVIEEVAGHEYRVNIDLQCVVDRALESAFLEARAATAHTQVHIGQMQDSCGMHNY